MCAPYQVTGGTAALLLAMAVLAPAAPAAEVYRCTHADGSIVLTDVRCPSETTRERVHWAGEFDEPTHNTGSGAYSVMNQARQIDARDAAKRAERDQRRQAAANDRANAIALESARAAQAEAEYARDQAEEVTRRPRDERHGHHRPALATMAFNGAHGQK